MSTGPTRKLLGALGAAVVVFGAATFSAAPIDAIAAARPESTGPAGTWAPGPPFPLEGQNVGVLSCGTPTFCGAVDGSEDAWTYLDGTWSYHAHIGDDSNLNALQCFANQTCLGADDQGHLVTYRNGAWSVTTQTYTDNGWSAMRCGEPDFCMFVDGDGQFYAWNGNAFSAPKVLDEPLAKSVNSGSGGEAYVACAAGTTFCAMADTFGNVATFRAGAWSGLTKLPSYSSKSGLLAKPSCVSATDCLAPVAITELRSGLKWAVYNGKDWTLVTGGTAGYPYADAAIGSTMSCAANFCMGLDISSDAEGYVPLRGFTFNGKVWAVTGFFGDNTEEPSLLSCTSSKWCMAIDVGGGGRTGPSWIFHPTAS